MRRSIQRLVSLPLLGLALTGCEYGGLARPSVLSQLDPPVARLIDELPELDASNEATLPNYTRSAGLPTPSQVPTA
jgi:hypothetical protein